MQFDAVKFTIPLKKRFVVSKGAADVKTNVLAIMNNRYIGEASGSVHAGPEVAEIDADLRHGLQLLSEQKEITVVTLEEIIGWEIHAAARSALSGMVLNYLSGEAQRYPWEVLGLSTPAGVKSSMTIGIDSPDQMIKSIEEIFADALESELSRKAFAELKGKLAWPLKGKLRRLFSTTICKNHELIKRNIKIRL